VCVADLALEMRRSVRAYTSSSAIHNNSADDTPRLVGILAEPPQAHPEERRAAETYSDTIAATLAQDGLAYEVCRCSWNADNNGPEAVEAAIQEQNRRSDVHGILVFYPIFPQSHSTSDAGLLRTSRHYYMDPNTGMRYKSFDDYLRDCVTPSKDVEGLAYGHEAALQSQQPFFRARGGLHLPNNVYIPCTAQAVWKILETYHLPKYYARTTKDKDTENNQAAAAAAADQLQRWQGQTVTVINRSSVLGRPLSALLALEGANVYSVDDRSILRFHRSSSSSVVSTTATRLSLTECLRQSSVIVTAVPPGHGFCLDSDAVADHTTIVNVASSSLQSSNVDLDQLQRRSTTGIQLISNVGKVTVAALEQNLIRLYQQSQIKEGE